MRMKKIFLAALLSAGIMNAGTSSAAPHNPFEDVPSDHWAYDAIARLASDGIIEGYGDGTYRGDMEITRYEMAQMVARAMARNPKGEDKALMDKLAAEFSDELSKVSAKERELVAGLKSMLGIHADVKLVTPKSIVRSEGKAVRVIDKRNLYKG